MTLAGNPLPASLSTAAHPPSLAQSGFRHGVNS